MLVPLATLLVSISGTAATGWPTTYTGTSLLADPQQTHAVSTMHNVYDFTCANTYRLIDSAWLFARTTLDASRVGEAATVAMLEEICASSTSGTLSSQCADGILTEAKILDTSSYRYFDARPGPLTRITQIHPSMHTFTEYRLIDSAWLFARTTLDASRVGEVVTTAMLEEICASSTTLSSQCVDGILTEAKILDTSDYRYFDPVESPVTYTTNTMAAYLWESRTFRLINSAWLFARTTLDASRVGEVVTTAMLEEICASSTSGTLSSQCADGILTEAKILDTSTYRYFDPVAYSGLSVTPVVVTTMPTNNTFTAGIYELVENTWMFGRTTLDASRVGEPVTLAMIREICNSSTSGTLSGYCTPEGVLTLAQTTDSSSYRFFAPVPYVSATDPSPPPAAPPYPPLPTAHDTTTLQSAPQWLRDALVEPRVAMKERHRPCCGAAETCTVTSRAVSPPATSSTTAPYLSGSLTLPAQSAGDLRTQYSACCDQTDCPPRPSLTPAHTIAFVALADMEAGAVEVTFDETTQTVSVYNAALRVASVAEAVKQEADARGVETIAVIVGDFEAEGYRTYSYNAQHGRNCSLSHDHVTFQTHATLAMLGGIESVVYSVGNHEFDSRGERAVADQAICMGKLGNVHMVSANVAYDNATVQPPLARAHATAHGTCVIGTMYQMADNSIPLLVPSQFSDVQGTVRDAVHGECAASPRRLSLHHGQGPTDALDIAASVGGLGAIFVAGSSEGSATVTSPNGLPRTVRKAKSPIYDRQVTVGTITFLGDHVVLDATDVDLDTVTDHPLGTLDARAMATLGEKVSDAFAELTAAHRAFSVPVGHSEIAWSNTRLQCTQGMHALGARALLDRALSSNDNLDAARTLMIMSQSTTRASLDAGNITLSELLAIDAFSASSLCFDMRVDDLVAELDNEHIAVPSARGTAFASNGIRMTVDMTVSPPAVASITGAGDTILYARATTPQFPDAGARLPVCMGAFQVMNGADGYSVFKQYYDEGTHAIPLTDTLGYYDALLQFVTLNNPVRSLGERVDVHANGDDDSCRSLVVAS
jgi:hypothetical protein